MSNDELTDRERDELRSLIVGADPPHHLESRVMDALVAERLIVRRAASRGPSRRWPLVAAAAVIAVVAFVAGLFTSVLWRPLTEPMPPRDDRGTYMLLLRESAESAPTSPERIDTLIAEYSAWAREKAEEGVLIGGEKLDSGGLILTPATTADWTRTEGFVGGFFLVKADDYEKAAGIAKTCPHLRHGGIIEIRRIDATQVSTGRSARTLVGRIHSLMLQDVDEFAKRVANIESQYTPGLAYRSILNRHVRFFEPC